MPLMRRRPLLRAAAVGGGAYMAGKHRAQSQEREAQQESRIDDLEQQSDAAPPAYAPPPVAMAPAPAPPGPAGISSDVIQQLTQLGQLRDQGILTEDEFATQKSRLLGG